MRTRYLAAATVAMLITSCSTTLPVKGRVANSSETFTGSATGYLDGAGDITLTSSEGAFCEGNFVYVTPRTGEGVISCNDGRSAALSFVSAGSRGTATAEMDGETVTFTFGNTF